MNIYAKYGFVLALHDSTLEFRDELISFFLRQNAVGVRWPQHLNPLKLKKTHAETEHEQIKKISQYIYCTNLFLS